MPATFQLDCPHCGTASVAFELDAESWLPRAQQWHVCARCNQCAGFVVLDVSTYKDQDHTPSSYYNLEPQYFEIKKMYPTSGAEIPTHLPEEVERLFKQGADNVPANPDAAGTMFRKTLEATLRDKCPTTQGTLKERIDKAVKSGVLSTDLGSYAHAIRLEGNEATHGTYGENDAKQLHLFLTLVLEHLYTLPGMREEIDAKARAAAESESATSEGT